MVSMRTQLSLSQATPKNKKKQIVVGFVHILNSTDDREEAKRLFPKWSSLLEKCHLLRAKKSPKKKEEENVTLEMKKELGDPPTPRGSEPDKNKEDGQIPIDPNASYGWEEAIQTFRLLFFFFTPPRAQRK